MTNSDDQERLLKGLEQAALGQYIENAGTRRTLTQIFQLTCKRLNPTDLEGNVR